MRFAFCSCRRCRAGRGRPFHQAVIRRARRSARRQERDLIRAGRFDSLPTRVSVSYTD